MSVRTSSRPRHTRTSFDASRSIHSESILSGTSRKLALPSIFSPTKHRARSPGRRDGLYWVTKAGEPQSPLGELVARASGEGYGKGKSAGPQPFHGYYYKMLKSQAASADSPALDYVVHGRAIGGFAVVAYPSKYGSSGIMTFIVNQDGKVYQADLGPSTQAKASAMQKFDPGKGWTPVSK